MPCHPDRVRRNYEPEPGVCPECGRTVAHDTVTHDVIIVDGKVVVGFCEFGGAPDDHR